MNTSEAIEYVETVLDYLCSNSDIVYGYTLCMMAEGLINQYQIKEICRVIACREADGKYSI